MMPHMQRNRLLTLLGLLTLVSNGCAVTPVMFRKDIVRIATFPDKRNPWLNFDDPPRDVPGGLKLPIYLTASDSPLGVFGDGTLIVDLYRLDRTPDGDENPVLVKQWSFDTRQAHAYGFRERQRVGWGYQLRLNWGDADVLDSEIMVIISFQRFDGRVIRGKRMFFKVPRRA